MSSSSPQPIPQVPPIESLAPPLPESNAAVASPVPGMTPAATKDEESWVPVEAATATAENAEQVLRTYTKSSTETGNGASKTLRVTDPSSTLFSRVMKQRASVMSQTPHVQKDNTLAIFVTLCLVVVAIACGIYFVADRETQTQGPEQARSALVTASSGSSVAPSKVSLAPVALNTVAPATVASASVAPSTVAMFGSPVKHPAEPSLANTKLDKSSQMILKSQTQLSNMQYIEAEYAARKATELTPASPEAWLALGRALFSQGRYAEAGDAFKMCIKRGGQSKATRTAGDYISQMPILGQSK